MQDISISTLLDMTIGLASGHNDDERFNKLLDAIRKAIQCDCIALLRLQGDTLIPLAMQGVTRDTLGRHFVISEHPRFQAICHSKTPLRFDANSPLPDPFDGLLLDYDGELPMHACMGLPLIYANKLLGILTLDSLTPNIFDSIPLRSLDALAAIAASTLKVALTVSQLEQQAKHVQQRLEELNEEVWERDSSDIIGTSIAMQRLNDDISVVAPSNFTILIQGETGVGKELVARKMHLLSPRRKQPLVYVNCAAIPENLVESELFGHIRGAFTGADKSRLGKFALADGGTLFLDEIGELPLAAQSKLLRALQSQEIQPVGQDKVQTIDVRVVAATNRDLKLEVNEGRFRSDLFHRLSVYPISVPALRERDGDIPLLAGYFLEQARRKLGIGQIKIAQQALEQLSHYNWPGNVRELEHVINRAALKARAKSHPNERVTLLLEDIDTIDMNPISDTGYSQMTAHKQNTHQQNLNLGTEPDLEPDNLSLKEATDNFQRQAIVATLSTSNNNWAQAARHLQLDRANLVRLAKRLGIEVTKQVKTHQ
ncbi:nitric oxide reductase transcriptional regulator NorR [Vibrio sinensis]|uniref:Nitric oxide reductase transcriptional regulator NorR n=1 Tax=Vibrio sinensis TaxID=2302434 RepID=A0A3A6QNB1_9VIBR|nr:nitric oxide reductase transcriptional regulator NorR [Vibrio sinensis]RJX69671.1 nitric oxide reductase transcriptional regulator NorR [Vibrio sinensis]